MAWLDLLFKKMVEARASDLHLTSHEKPVFRVDGSLLPLKDQPEIVPDQMRKILAEIAPAENWKEFEEKMDTDFAYGLEGVGRLRSNYYVDLKGPAAVFRLIPSQVMTAEELRLPKAILQLCHLKRGLVLVTGPTGSGKSTTLAAMIDYINRNRQDHIITIEDPVEFVHVQKNCRINQREVFKHTESFAKALRAALREDPDIGLVGEMRDLETVKIAIETAETGHLVLGTLHTTTAATTVNRIVDQFTPEEQNQIRTMLSSSLKAVIAQTLCKKIPKGRIAALEILIVNTAVAANIRDGKTHTITSSMQTGVKQGMRMLNDSLMEHVMNQTVDPIEAYVNSADKEDMLKRFEAAGIPVDVTKIGEVGLSKNTD